MALASAGCIGNSLGVEEGQPHPFLSREAVGEPYLKGSAKRANLPKSSFSTETKILQYPSEVQLIGFHLSNSTVRYLRQLPVCPNNMSTGDNGRCSPAYLRALICGDEGGGASTSSDGWEMRAPRLLRISRGNPSSRFPAMLSPPSQISGSSELGFLFPPATSFSRRNSQTEVKDPEATCPFLAPRRRSLSGVKRGAFLHLWWGLSAL